MNPLYDESPQVQAEKTPEPEAQNSETNSDMATDTDSIHDADSEMTTNKVSDAVRQEEQTFIDQLKQGDPQAYERFVRENMPRVLAVTRRLLRDEQEAQDASQDAFMQAFKKMDTFKGDARLSTWLHRIAVNSALMKLRQKKSRKQSLLDDLLPQFDDSGHRIIPEDEEGQVSHQLAEQEETKTIVRAAIDQLPDDYRTIILLRDVEQMDTREAAEELGVSLSVVKTRLHRARQALRQLLSPQFYSQAI